MVSQFDAHIVVSEWYEKVDLPDLKFSNLDTKSIGDYPLNLNHNFVMHIDAGTPFILWNLPLLSSVLRGYHDKKLSTFLQCGWHISWIYFLSQLSMHNNQGAVFYPNALKQNWVVPYELNTFHSNIAMSPISTLTKKDYTEYRLIVDTSFQLASSVTDGIEKDHYLNEPLCRINSSRVMQDLPG